MTPLIPAFLPLTLQKRLEGRKGHKGDWHLRRVYGRFAPSNLAPVVGIADSPGPGSIHPFAPLRCGRQDPGPPSSLRSSGPHHLALRRAPDGTRLGCPGHGCQTFGATRQETCSHRCWQPRFPTGLPACESGGRGIRSAPCSNGRLPTAAADNHSRGIPIAISTTYAVSEADPGSPTGTSAEVPSNTFLIEIPSVLQGAP